MFEMKPNADGSFDIYFEDGEFFVKLPRPPIPEDVKPEDRVEVGNHVIGDLLWAKVGNHPFWPCMVSYDPIEGCYRKTRRFKNRKTMIYHVQYFGEKVYHGWTVPGLIIPFKGEANFNELKAILLNQASNDIIKQQVDLKYGIPPGIQEVWHVAVKEAEVAMTFNENERYANFVFTYVKSQKGCAIRGESSKRKGKHKAESSNPVKKQRIDSEHNECHICEERGTDLTCSGTCLKSYHKDCLGLACTPIDFKCVSCDLQTKTEVLEE